MEFSKICRMFNPLIDKDKNKAIDKATDLINSFESLYEKMD